MRTRRHLIDLAVVIGLALAGFAYVSAILCGRGPWESRPGYSWELAKLLAGCLVLFPLGLRSTRAAMGFAVAPPDPISLRLALAGFFFLGLHWQFASKLTGADFSLTAHSLASLDARDAAALVVGVAILVALVALHIREARRRRIVRPFLAAIIGVVIVLALISILLRETHYFHLHHWTWAALLVPFARFPHPLSRLSQAFVLGVFVEGVARWGMGAVWMPN